MARPIMVRLEESLSYCLLLLPIQIRKRAVSKIGLIDHASLYGLQHVLFTSDIQEGLLLTGETGTGEVFGGGRRANRERRRCLPLRIECGVSLLDRSRNLRWHTFVLEELANGDRNVLKSCPGTACCQCHDLFLEIVGVDKCQVGRGTDKEPAGDGESCTYQFGQVGSFAADRNERCLCWIHVENEIIHRFCCPCSHGRPGSLVSMGALRSWSVTIGPLGGTTITVTLPAGRRETAPPLRSACRQSRRFIGTTLLRVSTGFIEPSSGARGDLYTPGRCLWS